MRADAGTVVERIDFAQVEIGEFEVEYVDILSDSSIDLQKPNLGRCAGTSQTTRSKVLAVEEVSSSFDMPTLRVKST